ncbi:unnamed protein product [Microthlaspi erraticum]|uniref:Uncharacterized protein n=1 Tax=Microthlaspi erraticum TaxID=1685480 RepID=A0A6D2HQU1_9BRAS|nr:unnamed protein product [Microthlaspi erraticum]
MQRPVLKSDHRDGPVDFHIEIRLKTCGLLLRINDRRVRYLVSFEGDRNVVENNEAETDLKESMRYIDEEGSMRGERARYGDDRVCFKAWDSICRRNKFEKARHHQIRASSYQQTRSLR